MAWDDAVRPLFSYLALPNSEHPDKTTELTGLYNRVKSDDADADRETVSLTVNRLLARNLRLLVEGGSDLEREKLFGTMGLVSAF